MPTVYTNVPASVSETWRQNTQVIRGAFDTNTTDPHVGRRGRFSSLLIAWRLFRKRRETDCFVTTGDLTGQALAFLQSAFPQGRKPHLIMSAIWTYPRNRFELAIRRALLSFAYRSVTDTFVNVTNEIIAYSSLFKLPKDKFSYLPYCYRLSGYKYQILNNGYIWAGGNGDRDYATLIEAVRNINYPVIINATRKSLFHGLEIPLHVKIIGVSPTEFRQYMAGCSFGVIPMVGGKLHSGGQQTFLGLMKMGKPVILMDLSEVEITSKMGLMAYSCHSVT